MVTQPTNCPRAAFLQSSDVTGKFNGNYGPIDPTREENYSFIKKLWTELKQVFPDGYIHLGGDEVSFQCWLVLFLLLLLLLLLVVVGLNQSDLSKKRKQNLLV